MSRSRSYELCPLVVVALTAMACSGSSDSDAGGTAFPDSRIAFERADRRVGYVANRNSDTVSVLDLDAMTLLGTVPVGRDPVDIDGPRHVVLDPANALAYLALSYPFSAASPHALSEGATQRSGYVEALNLGDLSVAGDLRVDPTASEVAFSAASGVLAVSHYDLFRALQSDTTARRANLALVDPARAIAAQPPPDPNLFPVCAVPAAMAFNGDGSRVFVACTGEDSLVVVDSHSGAVLARVPAGNSAINKPYALVGDAARERLLVSNQVAFAVSVFDMGDTPSLLSTLASPGVPFFATWLSDSTIAVPFQAPSGAALFDAATGELLVQIGYSDQECLNPAELTVTSDGRLRLVCEGDHYASGAVVELDPTTLAIQASVSVGIYPERLSASEP
ncbi:MAG: hypothetical protein ABW061_26450 [Polyangiaceae bacterium]